MNSYEIINKAEMKLILDRLAAQILEANPSMENVELVGIQRRGADLAKRLCQLLQKKLTHSLCCGTLDINLYRDDWTQLADGIPHIGLSNMPKNLVNKKVILIDDVLFSGRTIRAALEAILDYGRPQCVELLVFIDRGHRELPICANYTGRYIPTDKGQHIDVLFTERDGRDAVVLNEQVDSRATETK